MLRPQHCWRCCLQVIENQSLKKAEQSKVPLFLFQIKLRSFQFSVFNFQFIRTFAAVKKVILFCLFVPLFLFVSCKGKPLVTPPDDLIEEDTIVQMIADQLIVESVVFNAPPQYDKETLAQAHYALLFEKYKIPIDRYRSSLTYYFGDKERMERVMNRAKGIIDQKKEALPTQ